MVSFHGKCIDSRRWIELGRAEWVKEINKGLLVWNVSSPRRRCLCRVILHVFVLTMMICGILGMLEEGEELGTTPGATVAHLFHT